MEISREKLNEKLTAFDKLVEIEINLITQGEKVEKPTAQTPDYQSLRQDLEKVVDDISKTGDPSPYDWKCLRSFIIVMARDVLNQMHIAFPDMKSNQGESFDEELDVILQFISGFETKPPFTLQRICELLINPKKNYKSSKKILFALEKDSSQQAISRQNNKDQSYIIINREIVTSQALEYNNIRMLQTLSNCYEICYNPTNTSKSKQLFSIPRSQRFNDTKINCDKFYNLPELKNNRTTSLGYGTKTDFSKLAPKTPAAIYQLNTMFDTKHGYSFRLNREQVKCGGIQIGNKNPSPQHYNSDKSYLSNISYTMRALTPKSEDRTTNKFSPGPGRYNDQLALNGSGKYFIARYKDTKLGGLINPSQRPSQTRLTPGPGQYENRDTLSPDGLYRNSKYLSQSRTKFATTPRKPLRNVSYGPGPGGYKLPSDFGQYGSSRAYGGLNASLEKARRNSIKHNSSFLGEDFMKRSKSNLRKSLTQNFYNVSLDNSFINYDQKVRSDKKQTDRKNLHSIKKVEF